MAHCYGQPIAVTRAADATPASFLWRNSDYAVAEVFTTWHLMDRWWISPTNPATATYSLHHGEQDRTYYRVCCCGSPGEQVFRLGDCPLDTPCHFEVPRRLVADTSAVCYLPSSFARRSASFASRIRPSSR